jgi:hypothetical protein
VFCSTQDLGTDWQALIDGFAAAIPPMPMGYLTQRQVDRTAQANDEYGYAVAAGDFNADGADDLAIGAPGWDDPASNTGGVVVHYGAVFTEHSPGFEILSQSDAGATDEIGDRLGHSLVAGDFDDDGFDDLAVGVRDEDGANVDQGLVIVYYGSSGGLEGGRFERIDQGTLGIANATGDRFGEVLDAGDFDADGFDDLAVGMPSKDAVGTDSGTVIVLYGSGAGLTPVRFDSLTQEVLSQSSETGDAFGSSLAVGDFDVDGHDDLAVGIPLENVGPSVDEGLVVIYYGSSGGLTSGPFESLSQGTAGLTADSGEHFASSLVAGDFDNDGDDDLAVGAPFRDENGADSGAVVVFAGSSGGLFPANATEIGQLDLGATPESGDEFGASLTAGDVDQDGIIDLVIGFPGESDGASQEGIVGVVYGSATGLTTAGWFRFGQNRIGGIPESGDRFSQSLASGDFDGDGQAEIVVGAPLENDDTIVDSGAVYVWDRGFIRNTTPTAVAGSDDSPPTSRFADLTVAPNPFNPRTTVRFRVRPGVRTSLDAYDARGRFVASLYDGPATGSEQEFVWSADDVASGVYFLRLESGAEVVILRAVLLK